MHASIGISPQTLAPLSYYGGTGFIWRYGVKVVPYVWGEEEYIYTPCFMEVHLVAGASAKPLANKRCQPRAAKLDSSSPTAPVKS